MSVFAISQSILSICILIRRSNTFRTVPEPVLTHNKQVIYAPKIAVDAEAAPSPSEPSQTADEGASAQVPHDTYGVPEPAPQPQVPASEYGLPNQ